MATAAVLFIERFKDDPLWAGPKRYTDSEKVNYCKIIYFNRELIRMIHAPNGTIISYHAHPWSDEDYAHRASLSGHVLGELDWKPITAKEVKSRLLSTPSDQKKSGPEGR